jgi:hypothetical protein
MLILTNEKPDNSKTILPAREGRKTWAKHHIKQNQNAFCNFSPYFYFIITKIYLHLHLIIYRKWIRIVFLFHTIYFLLTIKKISVTHNEIENTSAKNSNGNQKD